MRGRSSRAAGTPSALLPLLLGLAHILERIATDMHCSRTYHRPRDCRKGGVRCEGVDHAGVSFGWHHRCPRPRRRGEMIEGTMRVLSPTSPGRLARLLARCPDALCW